MNLRSVSTEHNMSLLQLWTSGMLQNINSQHTVLTVCEMEQYGVDSGNTIIIRIPLSSCSKQTT